MELNQQDLIYGSIKQLLNSLGNEEDPQLFIDATSSSTQSKIVAELSLLLQSKTSSGDVECIEIPISTTTRLESRVITVSGKDGVEKTYFFRIKDAIAASTLPILGVLITLIAENYPSASIQIGSIAKTLWSNIVVLHHQQDGSALEILKTISVFRTLRFPAASEYSDKNYQFPSTIEINECINRLSMEKIQLGLLHLNNLRLIECKAWGGEAGNLEHEENRWGERL